MKRALMFLLAVAVVFMCTSSIAVADCRNETGECWAVPDCANASCGAKLYGYMSYGTCLSWTGCKPCHSQENYRRQCRKKFSSGGGRIVGCNCTNWYFSFRYQHNGEEIDN